MKGPKDGIVKASVKDTPIELRKSFSSSSSMFLISVGQPYHENEKLISSIELINNKFKTCTIMVCDTLQKYNLMKKFDKEMAYTEALKNGEDWLERNKIILSKLSIPHEILRWNDVLSNSAYEEKLKIIENHYASNTDYKNSFDITIKNYFLRATSRGESINPETEYDINLNYLKEECAGMLIWADKGYNFEIYPNKRSEVMESTYQLLILPYYKNVLVPVTLRFKRFSKGLQVVGKLL